MLKGSPSDSTLLLISLPPSVNLFLVIIELFFGLLRLDFSIGLFALCSDRSLFGSLLFDSGGFGNLGWRSRLRLDFGYLLNRWCLYRSFFC